MNTDISAQKQVYREQAIKHRDDIEPASEDIENAYDLFMDVIKPKAGQIVAAYWPTGSEFDISGVIERLLTQGITICLPRVIKDQRLLKFIQWDGKSKLIKGAFDILEPETGEEVIPDIVIAPFLAFDRRGYRLGYGGGYYDTTIEELRKVRPDLLTVGMGYAKQAVLLPLPKEEHDEKLDWVITPQATHYFRES